MADKKADLAGPGIGNYDELKQELPDDYESLLSPKENDAGCLCRQKLHRGKPVQRTQPANGPGSS